ncbi:MAG: hypothetical protein HY601_00200 [Candidatus Omnitrophica bacterium]|nr:hypothetical protein [Candidatus Omnitrophota bacterium]
MRRQALPGSRAGLLLVEAVLSAVVIAVGLVFISRSFSGQLRALDATRRQDTLMALARSKLNELEGERLTGAGNLLQLDGAFEAPYAAYRWSLEVAPREDWVDAAGAALMHQVILTIAQEGAPGRGLRVKTLWPSQWVTP